MARTAARGDLPPPLEYPKRLGYWPAVAGLVAFTALELVNSTPDDPSTVAIATLVYSVATFIGMALYGIDPWIDRGEALLGLLQLLLADLARSRPATACSACARRSRA